MNFASASLSLKAYKTFLFCAAGRNEYRISDNNNEKPKGIGYVKYDLFQLVITVAR